QRPGQQHRRQQPVYGLGAQPPLRPGSPHGSTLRHWSGGHTVTSAENRQRAMTATAAPVSTMPASPASSPGCRLLLTNLLPTLIGREPAVSKLIQAWTNEARGCRPML